MSEPVLSYPAGATALVTGGSRGIGREVVLSLASVGFDIWLNYRADDRAAAEVASAVEKAGRSCRRLKFDVADGEAVASALDPLLEETVPHVLVNNAGVTRDGPLAFMSLEQWNDVVRTTLDGFFHVTKAVLSGMLLQRKGRIVNISSTSGQAGRAGQVNYSAAKAGLIGATKALAVEVGKRGILVNAVAPGLIRTDMIRDVPEELVLPAIPLGRIGNTGEVASIVAYLCSEQASYITGQVIGCNGGLYV